MSKINKFAELKRRIWFLIGALIIFRIGAHIPVPGIDPIALAKLFKSSQTGLLDMVNMFSGGALSRFTIFALGLMPYISSSIILQLSSEVFPYLIQLKKLKLPKKLLLLPVGSQVVLPIKTRCCWLSA